MTFCPTCGEDHHADDRAAQAAVDREIEIARITADRDIRVAQINARIAREELETAAVIAETEGEAEVGAAAAEAAVLGELLNASDGPEAEPVIIDAPPLPEPEPDLADDAAPPPVEDHGEPEDDKPRRRGLGMW